VAVTLGPQRQKDARAVVQKDRILRHKDRRFGLTTHDAARLNLHSSWRHRGSQASRGGGPNHRAPLVAAVQGGTGESGSHHSRGSPVASDERPEPPVPVGSYGAESGAYVCTRSLRRANRRRSTPICARRTLKNQLPPRRELGLVERLEKRFRSGRAAKTCYLAGALQRGRYAKQSATRRANASWCHALKKSACAE
jgi:hypothetical protein